jgi:hypothetical protein
MFKKPKENRCHPFFLTPNRKFHAQDFVWFKLVLVGRNQLAEYTKSLAKDVPSLAGKRILNKTSRGVGITRLNEALVPIAKAMENTGHRTMDALEKYNQEKKILSERATQRVLFGEMQDGVPVLYEDAYKEDLESYKLKVLYLLFIICVFIFDVNLYRLLTNLMFVHQRSSSYGGAPSLS